MKVTLVDYPHNPVEVIYKAFRICYSKFDYFDIEKATPKEMEAFILKNVKKGHTTPLEHVNVTFVISGVSRALTHQLVRHRTFKFNQQSQRYVDGANFGYVIPDLISEAGLEEHFVAAMDSLQREYKYIQLHLMDHLAASNVPQNQRKQMANETARALLPNATTSQIVVTCDLNNFRKFYAQRNCKHAQDEIRELAYLMGREIKDIVPFALSDAMNCGKSCNDCTPNKY